MNSFGAHRLQEFSRRLAGCCALILLCVPGSLRSASFLQGQGARLTLSQTSGLPEAEIPVPLYFASGGISTGALSLEITFPARLLSFVKVEKSFLVDAVKGQVEAKVESDAGNEKATLKVTFATPPGESPREFIPDGPIANISFRIAKEAPLGTEIILGMRATGVTTGDPPGKIDPIATPDGIVSVKSVPLTACFFYMH